MTCNDDTFNADACYDQDGYRPDGSKVIYDYKQVHILSFAAFSLHTGWHKVREPGNQVPR